MKIRMNAAAGVQFETVVMDGGKTLCMILDREHNTVALLNEKDGVLVPDGRPAAPPCPFHLYADDRTLRSGARPRSVTYVKVVLRSGRYLYFLVKRYDTLDAIRFLHQRDGAVYTTDEELEPGEPECSWRVLREDPTLCRIGGGGAFLRRMALR